MSSKDALAHKLFHAPEVVAALPAATLRPIPAPCSSAVAEVDAAPDAGVDDLLQEVGEPPEVARLPGEARARDGERDLVLAEEVLQGMGTELVTQLWPDGWSGKFGVASGGVEGVAGSNSGRHVGSAVVRGLPSVAAPRIASIGRQKLQ